MKHNFLISLAALLCISLPFSCSSGIDLPPPPSPENPNLSSDNLSSSSAQTWSNSSSSSPNGGDASSTSGEQQHISSSSLVSSGGSSESNELGTLDGTYFTDPRDGKKYKYEIAPAAGGGKIWMKENLNYSRGNTLGWCYVVNGKTLGTAGADLSGCDSPNGRAYTYNIAIDGNKPQGLCPRGWHIPSVDEWTTLGAGTASSTTGNRRMSSAFYVYSGNYDYSGYEGRVDGWYDRDKNGFYWTNDNKNRFVLMGTSNGNNYFYSRSDAMDTEYYSIRCVANDGTFNISSSSGTASSSSTTTSNNSSSSATPSSSSSKTGEATCNASNASMLPQDKIVTQGCWILTNSCTSSGMPLKIYNYNPGSSWTGTVYCSDNISKPITCTGGGGGVGSNPLCADNVCAAGTTGAWLEVKSVTGTAKAESNCY